MYFCCGEKQYKVSKRQPIYEFHELYDDLNSVYKAVLREGHYTTQLEALEVAVNRPSKRFWVSPERLSEVVNAIETGGDARLKPEGLRRELYEELYRRYVEYRKEYPFLSKIEICTELVYQPAPKFYLKASWALKVFYRGRKRSYHHRNHKPHDQA